MDLHSVGLAETFKIETLAVVSYDCLESILICESVAFLRNWNL